jgi:hypothetical protein
MEGVPVMDKDSICEDSLPQKIERSAAVLVGIASSTPCYYKL